MLVVLATCACHCSLTLWACRLSLLNVSHVPPPYNLYKTIDVTNQTCISPKYCARLQCVPPTSLHKPVSLTKATSRAIPILCFSQICATLTYLARTTYFYIITKFIKQSSIISLKRSKEVTVAKRRANHSDQTLIWCTTSLTPAPGTVSVYLTCGTSRH